MSRRTRFSHLVINVSNLRRAVEFYSAVTPLRRDARTTPPAQAYESLGIDCGEFDGWLFRDPIGAEGPAIHLVEWRSPEPVGTTYDHFWNLGLYRLCFKATDVLTIYDDVISAGGVPFTEPKMPEAENVIGRPAFSVPDPDGVVVQHVTLPGLRRLSHVALNCSDLAASTAFFEALGLVCHLQARSLVPASNHFGGGGELSMFDAAFFECAGVASPDSTPVFSLDLCQWMLPEPVGSPYAAQNNLGIVRLGIAVDDLEGARRSLAEHGVDTGEPEKRDFGPEVGTRACCDRP